MNSIMLAATEEWLFYRDGWIEIGECCLKVFKGEK